MSDAIHHECGIALVRLKKPLSHYFDKFGTPLEGFHRLFLLMEKQHNRGQDGAGIGAVKLDMPPGKPFLFRERGTDANSLGRIFAEQFKVYEALKRAGKVHPEFAPTVKEHFDFGAEVLMGHLRYGTYGEYGKSACHPFFRKSNWPTKNLMLAGNFNMTNANELNEALISRGQHPVFGADTQTILEYVGYHLDEQHEALYLKWRGAGGDGRQIQRRISEELDPAEVLRRAAAHWDGGYAIVGLLGNGDSFALRDPNAIRPVWWTEDDDFFAVASERVALMTLFNQPAECVYEVEAGRAIIMKASGQRYSAEIREPGQRRCCSFERIYFSRGNDPDIYRERKALGAALAPVLLERTACDLAHTVYSFVPNTAETAFHGLVDELRAQRRRQVKQAILQAQQEGTLDETRLDELIMANWPRSEKVANKDVKLRTFISNEESRGQLVSHVYDITYGVVRPEDTLVCIDDSIVRGTTLRNSILRILSRTHPARIIIASTAPQIRYPDCYGIDMSELGKFICFQAAVSLLQERGQAELLAEVYRACLAEMEKPHAEQTNHVRRLYEPFRAEELSARIAEICRPAPETTDWQGELQIVFQGIEELHAALGPGYGDWYFTGKYPTPGGYAVLNRAYINYYEQKQGRSY